MIYAFLFLFNFFVRYFYIFLFLDPQKYIKVLPYQHNIRAEAFADGKNIFYPDVWSSFYLFIGSLYKLLHIFHLYELRIFAVVITNILLSSISIIIIYHIAKKITSKGVAFCVAIIFIFYYPSIYLNSLIMSENIFVPAILGFIYLVLFKSGKIELLLSGLLLGISLLCRPILFPFIPFLIIWLVLFKKKAFLLFIPAILILLTAGLINQKISIDHIFSIGTNGGVNFAMTQCQFKKLQYNGPNKATFFFTPPAFWNSNIPTKYSSVPFTDQGYYYKTGLTCLIKSPERLFTNLVYIKNIFWSTFYPNFPTTFLHKIQLIIWKILGVFFYILFLFYFFIEKRKKILPIYLFFALLFASLMLSVYFSNPGEERYLASYFFILDIFAVPAIFFLLKRVGLNKRIHRMKSRINQLRVIPSRKKESS